MINTLRAEFIKLRTVLVHWILAVIAIAFPIVVVTLVSLFGTFDSFESSEMSGLIVGITVVSAMLLGAMSAISVTSEYGHNTIRPTYAATPRRVRVVGSKVIVNTVVVGVVVGLTVAVSWIVASLILPARDVSISIGDDGVLPPLVSVVVLAISVTLFAIGLGLIIRNSPATVTILLLWPLLIEGLLGLVLSLIGWDNAGKWMPYQAAINAATETNDDFVDVNTLGRPMGLVYFAAISLALVAIGAALDQRRDA
jgi:ABC-2 type transport system permease protein